MAPREPRVRWLPTIAGISASAALGLTFAGVAVRVANHEECGGIGFRGSSLLAPGAVFGALAAALGFVAYQWSKIEEDPEAARPGLIASLVGLAIVVVALSALVGVSPAARTCSGG